MTAPEVTTALPPVAAAGRFRRRGGSWGLWLSLLLLGGLLLAGLFAPVIAPFAPTSQDLNATFSGVSGEHWLGTDAFGRDVLSRLIWGGRYAFAGVAVAIGVAVLLGIPWGLAAGFWPKWVGSTLLRIADAFMSFPGLVLVVAITGILGPSLMNSMAAIGVVFAPGVARILAERVSDVRGRDFLVSARLSGCPSWIILMRHVLPHSIGPVIVQLTVLTGLTFLLQGALSFLGLGIQPPTPSWGGDLAEAYANILTAPHLVLPPGILLTLVVLAVYRVGDSVRARLFVQAR